MSSGVVSLVLAAMTTTLPVLWAALNTAQREVVRVVLLSSRGPDAGQEGVVQGVVAGRFRADPHCHITVTVVNVVQERLSHYDRGGELKLHVVPVAADVVHHVLLLEPVPSLKLVTPNP